jgi:microcystin-dependent protein
MGQPFIGEIRMFGGSFAPLDWAFCDGQILQIADNEPLFQLIQNTYGGDVNQGTFALPDLRGRVPVHQDQNNGLNISESYGVESVTLTLPQLAMHEHPHAAVVPAGKTTPLGKLVADTGPTTMIYAGGLGTSQASALATAVVGAAQPQPHQNMMPYQGVSFIISLFGIFPSQV